MIRNFNEHWKALEAKTDEDKLLVPKITKSLVVTKWSESMADLLMRVVGSRKIPLSYVIRDNVAPMPVEIPDLAYKQPYSEIYGSFEGELIARDSHTHPIYREDNTKVYYYLEKATHNPQYAAYIKPFQRRKYGRGAWNAIVSQYASLDKWEVKLHPQDDLLHTQVWKGQSNYTLHRNAYISMQQC